MLAYGPGMPLAWIFGACYFVTAIVTQRWALLRLHRLPELAFNDKVRARALGLSVCAYALCMCMCTVYVGCTALYIACACAVHCMCKVIKRMIKWVKYMLLLHLFAAYITFRPLPCTSLRELHATFLSWLRSQSWFLPLVAEDSPWLVAAAFRGAYAANTTAAADEPSAPSDAISMGALVTLLVLLVALSGILVVCICDCTCARLCAAQSRRLQALTHDVVRSQDVSRWARKVTQMQMHVSCMCACAFACVCTHTAHTLQHVHIRTQVAAGVRRNACALPAQAAAHNRAGQPAGAAATLRRTRGRRAPGAPSDAQDWRLRPPQRGHAPLTKYGSTRCTHHTSSSSTRSRGGEGGPCSAAPSPPSGVSAPTRACHGMSGWPRRARRRTPWV